MSTAMLLLMVIGGCFVEKSPEDMDKQLPKQVTYNAEKGILSISVPKEMPKDYIRIPMKLPNKQIFS